MIPFEWMRLPDNEKAAYFWITAGLFLPGGSYLYFTNPNLFVDSGIVQLLIVSAFYSLPASLFSGAFMSDPDVDEEKDAFREQLGQGGIVSVIVFYGVAWWYTSKIPTPHPNEFLFYWYAIAIGMPATLYFYKMVEQVLKKIFDSIKPLNVKIFARKP